MVVKVVVHVYVKWPWDLDLSCKRPGDSVKIACPGLMAEPTEMCQNLPEGIVMVLVMGVTGHQPGVLIVSRMPSGQSRRSQHSPVPSQSLVNCLKYDVTGEGVVSGPSAW